MPGYQNENRSDYSKFDSMTNEELEEILRMDAMKSDDEESDIDTLMYVMGVLAERRKSSANPGKTPEEAYKSFIDNYYTEDTEVTEENIHNITPLEPKRKHTGWRRFLTAAAACFAVLLLGVVTSTALGGDAMDAFFDWTKEIFCFPFEELPKESGTTANYESVDDTWENVLRKKNIPEGLIPLQPLEGYEQVSLQITEIPEMRVIKARFENGKSRYRMTINVQLDSNQLQIEKTEDFLEIYEQNGVDYYIFSSKNQMKVVWHVDQYECIIVGNLSVEDILELINSIQEG